MGKVSRPVLNARNTYVRYRGPYLTRPRPPLARERARECPVCCLPRSVKLGLRGLHKWFRSLSTTLLYPSVGQAWVTGVLGVSLVAGVLGVRGGETACLLSNFNFRFQFFFFSRRCRHTHFLLRTHFVYGISARTYTRVFCRWVYPTPG